ncbi:uncharacterized protein LOC105700269 isoform X1 [Orussus abietinus]|uniref:uncharacterized protein LOC105700269 isoform X1 n=1 Tax=Orussus abietinus TaxID=222816 RepID=UPI000625CBA3|nr:uncharacterized protein LOC105700269 isoform X1 [Orussus abietinus]
MCDHCSKVTSQKGYSGQVTCKCEHGDKKDDDKDKDKDSGGCCSKKAREVSGGCCQSGCCKDPKEKKEAPAGGCGKEQKKDAGGCCGKK